MESLKAKCREYYQEQFPKKYIGGLLKIPELNNERISQETKEKDA